MNTAELIHSKIKKTLNSFIDDDLKDILADIIDNEYLYDAKSIYEDNIIIKIQHEKTLIKLNNNIGKLVLAVENVCNSEKDTNSGDDSQDNIKP